MVHQIFYLKILKRGFTLVEIMIVIALLGMLSVGGFASYQNSMKVSRDAKRKTDLESIRQALEMYKSDNGNYFIKDTTGLGAGSAGSSRGWFSYDYTSSGYVSISQALVNRGYLSANIIDPQYDSTNNLLRGYMLYPCANDNSSCNSTTIPCTKYTLYATLEVPLSSALSDPNCPSVHSTLKDQTGSYRKNYWLTNP